MEDHKMINYIKDVLENMRMFYETTFLKGFMVLVHFAQGHSVDFKFLFQKLRVFTHFSLNYTSIYLC